MENRIQKLEVFLALFLVLMPLFLIILTGEVRTSISDYAYSSHANYFVVLLSLASMLFIYNGWVKCRHWYNIILGLSLLGVAVTPHKEFEVTHYLCASIFFIGSVLTMVIFSSAKQRLFKMIAGALIIWVLAMALLPVKLFSLLTAEWIGLIPISIHFIGETLNKID